MISRLLCWLGYHSWEVKGIGAGFGFDREFADCRRCWAKRHVDFGVNRTKDIYSTTIHDKSPLRCLLGYHRWGLFRVEEIEVCPGEFIAHRWCKHCPADYYDDPDRIPTHLIEKP